MQDRNGLRNLPDKFHVMFNDDDGMLIRQGLKQFSGFVRFLIRHPRDGFINEEEFGVLEDDHPNFQPLFFSV